MIPALLALACVLSGAAVLVSLQTLRAARRPAEAAPPHPEVFARLAAMEARLEAAPRDIRADLGERMNELRQVLAIQFTQGEERFGRFAQEQGGHLAGLRTESATGRKDAEEAMARHVTGFSDVQTKRLSETNLQMKELRERTEAAIKAMHDRLETLTKDQGERAETLKEAVRGHLETLSKDNQEKLDQMRGVVDEKLSTTLNERLDSSFKQVSDRLADVHKGLGEMQTLATGVGDLKRVLTNVKSRGTWGEVQLGSLLEDMLTPDQFDRQVRVRPESGEVVDFVIRLPEALLPIDCKYPQEDYERLLAAQEAGDPALVEAAGKGLERALRIQAKSINDKYVHPPQTTNFAILYLPTEGLFAEVLRRAAFVQELQNTCRVTVAGPTTLSAILNSFRMGFATLEIQKKSSEIGVVLGQTKTAFEKYGAALDQVDKKLDEAKKKVADVGVRHREITRRLRGVEAVAEGAALEAQPSMAALASPDGALDEEAEAA